MHRFIALLFFTYSCQACDQGSGGVDQDTNEDTATDVETETRDGEVGAPCETESDCMGVGSPRRVCLYRWEDPERRLYWQDGYCSAECENDLECGTGAVQDPGTSPRGV